MELSIIERLLLLDMLPAEGDYTTLKIVRNLREALSFSEAEHAEFGLRSDPAHADRVMWETSRERLVEIEIGTKATQIITEAMQARDAEKRLTLQHMSLCDKFLGGDE